MHNEQLVFLIAEVKRAQCLSKDLIYSIFWHQDLVIIHEVSLRSALMLLESGQFLFIIF